jgi:predicted alpha/beta-hydrolase family hydrolase
VSYESGQEAANALVAQIKSSGGKAVAIQADMLKTAVDSVTRVTIPLGRPGMPEDIARAGRSRKRGALSGMPLFNLWNNGQEDQIRLGSLV